MKKNKNIAIVYRPDRPDALSHAKELAKWLIDKKHIVYQQPHQKILKNVKTLRTKKLIDNLDLVIVLGGDGTYLNAIWMLEGRNIPILGVNLGSLGFLTNTKIDDLYQNVLYTLEEKMELRPRTMLHVRIKQNKGQHNDFLALNDVVIERGDLSQLISLEILQNEMFVCQLKADGVVISTPTGSTAYNLAAGGPILHPEVAAFAVTPISPHSLTSRPLIFPDNRKLSFKLQNPSHKALLTIDGNMVRKISTTDEVLITKNKYAHCVVRKPTQNYFDLLREKLKFGQRD